jgi:hypothetical protein
MIHLQARSPDPAEVEVRRGGEIGRATGRISARRTGETGAAVPTRAVVVAIGALAVVAQAAAVIAYLVAAVAESTATVAGAAGVTEAEAAIGNAVGATNVANDLGADGADLQMVVLVAAARTISSVKLLMMP